MPVTRNDLKHLIYTLLSRVKGVIFPVVMAHQFRVRVQSIKLPRLHDLLYVRSKLLASLNLSSHVPAVTLRLEDARQEAFDLILP